MRDFKAHDTHYARCDWGVYSKAKTLSAPVGARMATSRYKAIEWWAAIAASLCKDMRLNMRELFTH